MWPESNVFPKRNHKKGEKKEKRTTFSPAEPMSPFLYPCTTKHSTIQAHGVEDTVIGAVPAGTVIAEGVDRSARHLDVLSVELADHVHARGVVIGGLKILWLVELGVHHERSRDLARRLADAGRGLVVDGVVGRRSIGTWHHGCGPAVHEHGLSGRDASTHTTRHHDRGTSRDRATAVHHRLSGARLLRVDGYGEERGGVGLNGWDGDTGGSLCENSKLANVQRKIRLFDNKKARGAQRLLSLISKQCHAEQLLRLPPYNPK